MDAEIVEKLNEFRQSMEDANEAFIRYIKSIAKAREKSEELSTLLQIKIKQPHIEILDFELDG
jgi:hypothetical protein